MSPQALEALEAVLVASERRADRGEAPDGATFPFTNARLASYYRCNAAELQQMHADLAVVARIGAITIDWDPNSAERGRILRLRAADTRKLATVVGRLPRWEMLAVAERELETWAAHPRIERLLAAWRTGKSPRSKGADSWAEWRDSLRVLDSLTTAVSRETPLRRLSTALFDDSKRIERLASCLDYLTTTNEDDPPRDSNDLFAELGLPRFPQPLLVSVNGAGLRLTEGTTIPAVEPYVGLAPEQVAGFDQPLDFVMTIENLSSFNEAARQKHAGARAALIYTAGMPGPRFLAAYRRLLRSGGPDTQLLHWGDMDLGGLRIAAKLAAAASAEGFKLRLHDFVRSNERREGRKELTEREKAAMVALCERWGWIHERDFVISAHWAREQEEELPKLPWAGRS